MRVLIALDLNDDDLREAYGDGPVDHHFDDVVASLDARLRDEAGYFGSGDYPVRGPLVSACVIDHALPHLLDCAEVGAEGSDHDDAQMVIGAVQTMRQGA